MQTLNCNVFFCSCINVTYDNVRQKIKSKSVHNSSLGPMTNVGPNPESKPTTSPKAWQGERGKMILLTKELNVKVKVISKTSKMCFLF